MTQIEPRWCRMRWWIFELIKNFLAHQKPINKLQLSWIRFHCIWELRGSGNFIFNYDFFITSMVIVWSRKWQNEISSCSSIVLLLTIRNGNLTSAPRCELKVNCGHMKSDSKIFDSAHSYTREWKFQEAWKFSNEMSYEIFSPSISHSSIVTTMAHNSIDFPTQPEPKSHYRHRNRTAQQSSSAQAEMWCWEHLHTTDSHRRRLYSALRFSAF